MADRDSQVAIVDEINNPINAANPLPVEFQGGFGLPEYDDIAITYVAAGDGAGKMHTIVYSLSSVVVATLTIAYDSSDRMASVIKT